MDYIEMNIEIPTDIDGFILLKCPLCNEFFKLRSDEMGLDDVISIRCPYCGLTSDDYLTDDVIELALKMIKNKALEIVHDTFKNLEKSMRNNKFISFKAGKKSKEETENPIYVSINALDIENYCCCKRQAKIKPIEKFIGSYCPYCGVRI